MLLDMMVMNNAEMSINVSFNAKHHFTKSTKQSTTMQQHQELSGKTPTCSSYWIL